MLYAVSDVLYVLIYHVFGYRKEVVTENLKLVFPEKSDLEIKTIRRKFYHHLCDMILESIKSMNISLESMQKRYMFKNLDIIKDFEKQNKSIVLMCAHYGSWEWIFILQAYTSHRGYAIYKRLQNKYFDRFRESSLRILSVNEFLSDLTIIRIIRNRFYKISKFNWKYKN